MAGSLRDQLLKAGVVDKKAAKKAANVKKVEQRKKRKGKQEDDGEIDLRKAEILRKQAEQAERDRELNRKREEKARKKAINAEVHDIVTKSVIKKGSDNPENDIAYNFVDKEGKIKKIYVSENNHAMLTKGQLAIVRHRGEFKLIPPDAAEKIEKRAPDLIYQAERGVVEDIPDEYADYEIPDDLMW